MTNGRGDFAADAQAAYPALMRAATVLCRSKSDVEDVVQEALLRACKSYGSFRGDSSFLTWSYTILSRTAREVNQKRSRDISSDYAQTHPQQLPPVERAVIVSEEARKVIDAIRRLPERQREIMTLHFLEELSYAQIAEALGVAIGTVKATVFEARTALRAAMSKKKG